MITCTLEDGSNAQLRHAAVEVLVVNSKKNKVLLARRANWLSEPGKLSLPGGYIKRDELLVQTVSRICKEETGYSAKIVSLFRINDNIKRTTDDKENIIFTFILIEEGKNDESVDIVNQTEWFDFNGIPPGADFAGDNFETIQLFLLHLKNPFAQPIIGKNMLVVI